MPQTAADGAKAIQAHALKLFSRSDGMAADWSLMAESLFQVAFYCLDRSADPARQASILRRLESGTYDRLVKNEPEAFDTSAPSPETSHLAPQVRRDGPELAPGHHPTRRHRRH